MDELIVVNALSFVIKAIFSYLKLLEKEKKMLRKIIFFIFDFSMKNMKENKIYLKLLRYLYILKLFNLHIKELNK